MKTLTSFRLPLFVAALGLSLGTAVAQPLYPTGYQNFVQGNTGNGLGSPTPDRSNPANAVIFSGGSDVDMGEANANFVSLGFGGRIDLVFSQPFGDGEGADLTIFETSYGTPACDGWPEYADVYVSQDGCNWVLVRTAGCQNFDIELPDNLPWGLYVRIVDVSVNASFADDADGYDVDGVKAHYASSIVPGDANGPRFATGQVNFIQGKTKNGAMITANRSIPAKAVGPTTGSDASQTPIFVSLGFDVPSTPLVTEGKITLTFDYTVFDRAGPDLTVFETTFNDRASRPCNNYPEIALFEGSNDGVTFYTLAADPSSGEPALPVGQLCRDGLLDIGSMPAGAGGEKTLRYLRITDMSIKADSDFPGAADGYDVDGVYGYGCGTPNGGKYEFYDQNNVPDEDASLFTVGLFPNPTANVVNINLETAAVDQNYSIRITDLTGRLVMADALNAAANSSINHVMDVQYLPAGVYMVTVEANGYKALNKLMKN